MTPPRLAITMLVVLLALGAAAGSAVAAAPGSAVGATSQLVPSVPWLAPAPAPRRPAPATVTRPAASPSPLPNTGFPLWAELLVAGLLLCSGTAIRGRSRSGRVVRLEPVLAARR